ncbi:MAG TPA: AAA family ATPase [Longimicrobium sp.]|nr:AAA family ATPase [Longimicrobium sp.]
MKQDVPLRSFKVEGYRGIRHLELPRLERVNLFVGLNNAGKTSFLESVQLYASRTPRTVLASILRERSGFRPRFSTTRNDREVTSEQVGAAVEGVRSLFYGTFSGAVGDPIRLGAADGTAEPLTISLPWATSVPVDETGGPLEMDLFLEPDSPLVELRRGGQASVLSVDWFLRRFGVMLTGTSQSTALIPAQGLDVSRLARLWDEAAAAGYASEVEDALRSVVSELERIHLLGEPGSGGRSISMQLAGTPRPLPLTTMGDGTNRVFALALSCVRARGGVLLVDEVENGLHYTVHGEVWDSIFTLAERLDVQVFATTHSWDTVVGFQHAANRSPAEGILYRLDREADGWIHPVRYTEEEVAIAADQQIEVR